MLWLGSSANQVMRGSTGLSVHRPPVDLTHGLLCIIAFSMMGFAVGARPRTAVARSAPRSSTRGRHLAILASINRSSNPFNVSSTPFWSSNPSYGSPAPGEPESQHNGLPDYSLKTGKIPDYSIGKVKKNSSPSYSDSGHRGTRKTTAKKAWWNYSIPAASSFSGYVG